MNIIDLFETSVIEPNPDGYSSEEDDQSVLSISDVRKTRLTLGHLQKLRIINDIRKLEFEKKSKIVSQQYKAPAADAGGL